MTQPFYRDWNELSRITPRNAKDDIGDKISHDTTVSQNAIFLPLLPRLFDLKAINLISVNWDIGLEAVLHWFSIAKRVRQAAPRIVATCHSVLRLQWSRKFMHSRWHWTLCKFLSFLPIVTGATGIIGWLSHHAAHSTPTLSISIRWNNAHFESLHYPNTNIVNVFVWAAARASGGDEPHVTSKWM